MNNLFDLSGKVAVVTGASSGIGIQVAKAYEEQGASVALFARRYEKLEAVAKEIKALGRKALPVQCDVTQEDQVIRAIDKVIEEFGKIDILMNNAGTASNEQAIAVEQVNQGIIQISDVVQTTSATSEETAATSEELSIQAELLKEQVNTFKLKNTKKLYSDQELQNLNPEVLKMLDTMKPTDSHNSIKNTHEESNGKIAKRIELNNSEFGKY